MATIDFISFSPSHIYVEGEEIIENPVEWRGSGPIVFDGFPVLSWSNGERWSVADAWAVSMSHRLEAGDISVESLVSNAYSVKTYMEFLEEKDLCWSHFPLERGERCLVRYRGWLIAARRDRRLAGSTVKSKMSVIVMFYKWVFENGFFDLPIDVFSCLTESVRIVNRDGFNRTMIDVASLRIRNAKADRQTVEGGLMPLSIDAMNVVMDYAFKVNTPETYLKLGFGFLTGARLGTICDLKVATFMNAKLAINSGYYEIEVGPQVHGAPVATKFGVSGTIPVPIHVYDLIMGYIDSPRRIARVASASKQDRGLVFLNVRGKSYSRHGGDRSSSMNVEMAKLRAAAKRDGLSLQFKFHQARATFGTMYVANGLLADRNLMQVLGELKEIMLHRSESTTMTYVKFVQSTEAKAVFANDYMKSSMGLQKKW